MTPDSPSHHPWERQQYLRREGRAELRCLSKPGLRVSEHLSEAVLVFLLAVATATMLTGCGGGSEPARPTVVATNTISGPRSSTTAPTERPSDGGETLKLSTPDDTRFATDRLDAGAGTTITVEYTNDASIPHNVHFFAGKDATAPSLGMTEITPGPNAVTSVSFSAPPPGTYYFRCDVHPDQMQGQLVVR